MMVRKKSREKNLPRKGELAKMQTLISHFIKSKLPPVLPLNSSTEQQLFDIQLEPLEFHQNKRFLEVKKH